MPFLCLVYLQSLSSLWRDCPSWGLELHGLQGPFQPTPFCDSKLESLSGFAEPRQPVEFKNGFLMEWILSCLPRPHHDTDCHLFQRRFQDLTALHRLLCGHNGLQLGWSLAPGWRYLLRFPGQEPNAMFVISFKVFAWQVAQRTTVVCRKAGSEGNMDLIWASLKWSLVKGGTGKKSLSFFIFLLGFPSREESNSYGVHNLTVHFLEVSWSHPQTLWDWGSAWEHRYVSFLQQPGRCQILQAQKKRKVLRLSEGHCMQILSSKIKAELEINQKRNYYIIAR